MRCCIWVEGIKFKFETEIQLLEAIFSDQKIETLESIFSDQKNQFLVTKKIETLLGPNWEQDSNFHQHRTEYTIKFRFFTSFTTPPQNSDVNYTFW